MAATREDIQTWFLEGKEVGATHMIVMRDGCDGEEYPCYVEPEEHVLEEIEHRRKDIMQKIMGVYDLALDMDEQLRSGRVWNTGEAANE